MLVANEGSVPDQRRALREASILKTLRIQNFKCHLEFLFRTEKVISLLYNDKPPIQILLSYNKSLTPLSLYTDLSGSSYIQPFILLRHF